MFLGLVFFVSSFSAFVGFKTRTSFIILAGTFVVYYMQNFVDMSARLNAAVSVCIALSFISSLSKMADHSRFDIAPWILRASATLDIFDNVHYP